MNKWIKFLQDVKDHKTGEIVNVTATKAAALIEAGIAEETQAPAEVAQATKGIGDEIKALVQESAKTVATEIINEVRASVKSKGLVHPIGDDIQVGFKLPATVKRYGSLRNFKGEQGGRSADQRAFEFGMWMLGMFGNESARKYCADHGMKYALDVAQKVSRENSNVSSAYLVPDQFENDLIDLRETYGVFRKNAKIVPMASDTRSDPRRTGGLTAYFVGESTAPTASDKTWDRVRLIAKKVGCLAKYTNELNEDAVLNIGDDLAGEIAYAFAALEDDCGFNGDGTSAYGGIVGIRNAFLNLSATRANIAGLVVGAGNQWSELTLANFHSVLGLLPQYAFAGGNAKWYCSQAFWGGTMQRLALAAGGVTATEIVNGLPQPRFLGYPVEIAQKMPQVEANDVIPVLFGNMRLSSRFGDRRSTSIRMSDHALNTFEQDEVAIVGFERFDIVNHDIGNQSGTAASRVPGPMVGLLTAAS